MLDECGAPLVEIEYHTAVAGWDPVLFEHGQLWQAYRAPVRKLDIVRKQTRQYRSRIARENHPDPLDFWASPNVSPEG
jgi:hypothetical protein